MRRKARRAFAACGATLLGTGLSYVWRKKKR